MKKIDSVDTQQLIDSIYASVLDKTVWSIVVEQLADCLSASSAMLRLQNNHNKQMQFYNAFNLDRSWLPAYCKHFIKQDPFLHLLEQRPIGSLDASHLHIPNNVLHQTEFYNDFMRPQDIAYAAGGFIAKFGDSVLYVGAQRSTKRGHFDKHEIDILKTITPHLKRAVEINFHINKLEDQLLVTSSIMDNVSVGIITITKDLIPLQVNSIADSLIKGPSEITLRHGQLHSNNHHNNNALNTLLNKATSSDTPQSGTLSIYEKNGQMTHLLVIPVNRECAAQHLDDSRTAAIIFIGAQIKHKKLSKQIISMLYGLTPQEARLATSLAQGYSLEEITQSHGVSINTTRSQLKSIFNKTGVKRQGELIKTILSGPAGFSLGSPDSRTLIN